MSSAKATNIRGNGIDITHMLLVFTASIKIGHYFMFLQQAVSTDFPTMISKNNKKYK
jgi:hypothetical protein